MKKKMQEKEETRETPENNEKMNAEAPAGSQGEAGMQAGESEEGAQAESSVEAAADKVVEEVRLIEEKLAEMQDRYIRLSAEFDNYRKRTLKEKMELSKYAEENLLAKIIPFMDDFDRAISHMDTDNIDAIRNGISLIYSKFSDFLRQNGVNEIDSMNSDFNVDLHEAVAKVQVDSPDKKGKVVDVVLKGYYFKDKVLRFSKVVVGE